MISTNKPYSLMHGDCLALMDKLPSNSVDMILTDLPYGVLDTEWDKKLPLDQLWTHYRRIIKAGGIVALFAKQGFAFEVGMSNRKAFKYKIVWQKTQGTDFFLANKKPLSIHEDVLLFVPKGGKTIYNQQRRTGFKPVFKNKEHSTRQLTRNWKLGKRSKFNFQQSYKGDDTRCPVDVLTFPVVKNNKHSTSKPIPLLEWLIRSYTNEGMTVLDSCMGTGSTGIAAINTGRRFIGIEKHHEFFIDAVESIHKAYQAKQSLLDIPND